MEDKEKRKPRSYKCTDTVYDNAMNMAAQKGTDLAKVIEKFVIKYGNKKQKQQ
jgi:hypothetical protein